MPLPRRLARFNRIATNRVGLHVAGWAPGFAIIEHRGRVTGRRYRTPVAAFVKGGAFTIALTYGPGSEWVKNVVAAGRCDAQWRGRRLRLTDPRVVHDEQRRPVPVPVRWALRLLGAADFLQASIVPLVGEHAASAARLWGACATSPTTDRRGLKSPRYGSRDTSTHQSRRHSGRGRRAPRPTRLALSVG